jgi:hypothetical protein
MKCLNWSSTTLEACRRLALREGQKENRPKGLVNVKVKLFVALSVVGAVLTLYGLCVPWLSFIGVFRNVLYGAFEVSGSTYGFGFGTLDRTSAQVTVWSGEYWSTAGSDFWFGWLSIAGALLTFASAVTFIKLDKPRISTLLVVVAGALSAMAFVLATHYLPQTFVAHGQIDDSPVDIGVVQAENANISIGLGPWLSLAGGVLSIIGITLAYYFRSKQKE